MRPESASCSRVLEVLCALFLSGVQRGHLPRDLLLHHRAERAHVDAGDAAEGGDVAGEAARKGRDLARQPCRQSVQTVGDRTLHLVDAVQDRAFAPRRVALLLTARIVDAVDRLLKLFEPFFQVLLVLRGD